VRACVVGQQDARARARDDDTTCAPAE